nr:hypothetical protein [Halomonas caseinilytica]
MGVSSSLPDDDHQALLVGQAWRDDARGPVLAVVRHGQVFDISEHCTGMADLFDRDDVAALVSGVEGELLGTMFSPIQDRDGAGQGFTHHIGDSVTIATPSLGALVNDVDRSDRLPPWTFGIRQWQVYMTK